MMRSYSSTKRIAVLAVMAFATTIFTPSTDLIAQDLNDYERSLEKLRNESNAQIEAIKSVYAGYIDSATTAYEEYRAKMIAEYDDYCKEVQGLWGDDSIIVSKPKEWVEYNDDLSSRSVVNFEEGDIKVELLLDPDDAQNSEIVDKKLQEAIEQLLASKGQTINYDSKYQQKEELSDTPIINGLVDLTPYGYDEIPEIQSSQERVAPQTDAVTTYVAESKPATTSTSVADIFTSGNAPSSTTALMSDQEESRPKSVAATIFEPKALSTVAQKIVEQNKPSIESRSDSDGNQVVVATVNLSMIDGYTRKLAMKYQPLVTKYSQRYSIKEPVIYAVIEQESYFVPDALSHCFACGLMQLIPTSGARDAYKYVYKEDVAPTREYLFIPENNIELGTAFLKILMTRYFGKIEDPDKVLLCAIASYNCGAGRLSQAVTGSTNLSKAISTINEMSYESLYDRLQAELPDETKNYVARIINERMGKYSHY